jgi:hypothetical protein
MEIETNEDDVPLEYENLVQLCSCKNMAMFTDNVLQEDYAQADALMYLEGMKTEQYPSSWPDLHTLTLEKQRLIGQRCLKDVTYLVAPGETSDGAENKALEAIASSILRALPLIAKNGIVKRGQPFLVPSSFLIKERDREEKEREQRERETGICEK